MRVFQPRVVEGLEWVQPIDEADYQSVYQLDGTPRAARWHPVPVCRLEVDARGRPLRPADLPWLGGHALVFRDAAYRAVGDVLAGAGEFLELVLVDGTDRLWLFNAFQVVDALDEEASAVVRFPSTGSVMRVTQHVFHPERVAGLAAFRIAQVRSLFLSGDVVDVIRAANLTGAEFDLVWERNGAG